MSQCDLQAAMACAAPAARHARRGVYQELMSARESAMLLAQFQQQRSPDQQHLQALGTLCELPEQRVYKFFNNQRFSRKRKADALTAQPDLLQQQPVPAAADDAGATAALGRCIATLAALHAPAAAEMTSAAVAMAAAAACSAAAATGPEQLGPLASLSEEQIRAELSAHLSVQLIHADAHAAVAGRAAAAAAVAAAAVPTAGSDAAAYAGACKKKALTAGRCTSATRLERFHAWLQGHGVDPFTCARRCDVLRLALLVEQYGRPSNTTSFAFAGACVLRAALEQCHLPPPESLSQWQELLARTSDIARLSRQADSLWYHVRRGGAAFCESVPTKAREDTLTALGIIAAVAPHDRTMAELVGEHRATADARVSSGSAPS
jgi:hypothetical protein